MPEATPASPADLKADVEAFIARAEVENTKAFYETVRRNLPTLFKEHDGSASFARVLVERNMQECNILMKFEDK